MTLYAEIVAAGIEVGSHESDLYVPDTEATREILTHHPSLQFSGFTNQTNGEPWLDVPFAYDPWWERRAGKKETSQ